METSCPDTADLVVLCQEHRTRTTGSLIVSRKMVLRANYKYNHRGQGVEHSIITYLFRLERRKLQCSDCRGQAEPKSVSSLGQSSLLRKSRSTSNTMPTRPPVSFQAYTDISPGTNSAEIFIQNQFSYQPTRHPHKLRHRLNQQKFQSECIIY